MILVAICLTSSQIFLYCWKKTEPLPIAWLPAAILSGHENWINSCCFQQSVWVKDSTDFYVLLATASQDKYIRLWKISSAVQGNVETGGMHSFQASKGENMFLVSLEALLLGHDDWIYSVRWSMKNTNQLVSASADKSVMLWEPDRITGIWNNQLHFGALGGTSLGYFGALFSAKGDYIISHEYSGSFHLWKYNKLNGIWSFQPSITGHIGSVEEINWNSDFDFFISLSKDQTTRVHCECTVLGQQSEEFHFWHEIARPQIHGYDLKCGCFVDRFRFVSGADEKVFSLLFISRLEPASFRKYKVIYKPMVMSFQKEYQGNGKFYGKGSRFGCKCPSFGTL